MHFTENLFVNFHAHQTLPDVGEMVIQSKFLQENLISTSGDRIFFTSGLHPWHADLLSLQDVKFKLQKLIHDHSILAVGETGLDKLKGPKWEMQWDVFKLHLEIAEEHKLPLIIHSVRAHNEILKMKIDSKSKIPWAIHHFNGSKQQAMDFIHHGFYLSLNYHIANPISRLTEYLTDIPIDKIFLETDDFDIYIQDLYTIAAKKYGFTIDHFKNQLIHNLNTFLNEK